MELPTSTATFVAVAEAKSLDGRRRTADSTLIQRARSAYL